jgi:FMN phosphatase YigB (HAD superfamily)
MILLFDIDGVLVNNLAYRAGIQQTQQYFAERLRLTSSPPTQTDIDVFEAESITIEWDTCAIIASALLLARLGASPTNARQRAWLAGPPADFWQLLETLPALPKATAAIDYQALARRVGAAAHATGLLPARAALGLFLEDLAAQDRVLSAVAEPLLRHLLGHIYSIDDSPGMQVFQNYVLGDEKYAAYYEVPPRVTGEGLLEALDEPLMNKAGTEMVLKARAAGGVYPGIYTARPSLAPAEAFGPRRGYTPESEIACQMVGLESLPVMGFGKLRWLAERISRAGSQIVKPSPIHSMAALAAARTGLELEAIKAAVAVDRGGYLRYPLTACAGESVHVFEDSTNSLGAVKKAVAELNRLGLRLTLTCHGIAPQGSPKRETLATEADYLHEDVNEGVLQVLGSPAG